MSQLPELLVNDVDPAFCAQVADAFAGSPGSRTEVGSIAHAVQTATSTACIVHPGNPFGLCISGLDEAIWETFGPPYIRALQSQVKALGAELPVGTAFMVETGHPITPFAVYVVCYPHTPNIAHTGLSAVLRCILTHNHGCAERDAIRTAICPGLGTYRGCTHGVEAARQMAAAWLDVKREIDSGLESGGGEGSAASPVARCGST
eukprot:5059953-Prymnesium_polylepis.1